jgi:hypothetical protein
MSLCVSCNTLLPAPSAVFGAQIPSAVFNRSAIDSEYLSESALDLSMCVNSDCLLVQLFAPVNLDYVYQNYPYQTGTTMTMSQELKEFATSSVQNLVLNPDDVILDIGGNDGTLLSNFKDSDFKLINIDAASNVVPSFVSENYTHKSAYFTQDQYWQITNENPKVIFSSAMFYQLMNPNDFCADIAAIMSDETIFFLQMTYLDSMFQNRVFDNVVHEHVTYFSLYSLERLLDRHGLRVVDASINSLYGGSLRVSIRKVFVHSPIESGNVEGIRKKEELSACNQVESLTQFGIDFENWKSKALEFLNSFRGEHKRLIGLGASTKGNMLLQALSLSAKDISLILDNNKIKVGSWTTKTLIPIVDEATYVYDGSPILVLPYYYLEALLPKIQRMVPLGSSVEVLTLLPHPNSVTIVGSNS